jgi:2-polyprenyl-3-methyl-5-hydroxy-6-metoxy-1,4-benzoquinol methylase
MFAVYAVHIKFKNFMRLKAVNKFTNALNAVQFMNPQLSYEYLDYFYSTYMRDESQKEENTLKLFDICLSSIEKIKPEKGNLLDIGCGNGFLIRAANRRGWKTSGHEINCEDAKKLSEKLNIKIYCGDITSINLDTKFNTVTMFHVLEHLKNPLQHIKYIRSILNEQGILLLALPNILNRSAIFKLFLERIKIRRTEIAVYYDIQHHLWYFSPASVRIFLERNGSKLLT